MSDPHDPTAPAPPSEEELRAAYEAELARITAVDMIAQSAVSLLNIGARRIGPPPGSDEQATAGGGRDLEQVRDAIDGARALLAILERRIPPQELAPLKDALSRLQMAYAQEVGGAPAAGEAGGEKRPASGDPPPAAPGQQQGKPDDPGPGPAESSGRLWVPGR
jgi:hypothetical protein